MAASNGVFIYGNMMQSVHLKPGSMIGCDILHIAICHKLHVRQINRTLTLYDFGSYFHQRIGWDSYYHTPCNAVTKLSKLTQIPMLCVRSSHAVMSALIDVCNVLPKGVTVVHAAHMAIYYGYILVQNRSSEHFLNLPV